MCSTEAAAQFINSLKSISWLFSETGAERQKSGKDGKKDEKPAQKKLAQCT
jgi:hypothetical protein